MNDNKKKDEVEEIINNQNTERSPSNPIDTHSYKGWMNSDSFIKRCFGVVGHGLMGWIFIYLGLILIFLVFGALGFGISFGIELLNG